MSDRSWIKPIVERVVAQVLESHAAQLRSEITRRVMEEVSAAPTEAAPVSHGAGSGELARAVAEIQLGTNQKEILRALLEGCARYGARVALFIVKGGKATGWQGRGFRNNDALKDFSLDVSAPAIARAVDDRVVIQAKTADLDSRFMNEFGTAKVDAYVLPLVLKDKVAALIYADSGVDGAGLFDGAALEALVLTTSAWLEVNALRKQAHRELPPEAPADFRAAPAAQVVSAYSDPFAGHAPTHAMAAAASSESHSGAAVAEEPMAPAPEPPALVAASSEEQDVHRKAQRFARLLVDEIKLYNQAKVTEGRKNKDLYDRLKETIEKSRSTYQKRYGSTVAASAGYFQLELVRSLAEDDVSIMGANFRN
jgi:hypothetical protein